MLLPLLFAIAPQTVDLGASLADHDSPRSALFTPDGRGLIVRHGESVSGSLTYLDLVLGRVTAESPRFADAEDFCLTPDGARALYVEESGRVQVLAVPTLQVLAQGTSPGTSPHWRIRMDPTGARAVLRAMSVSGRFSVVSTVTGAIERTFQGNLSLFPFGASAGMGIAPGGTVLFVADQHEFVQYDLLQGIELARTPYSAPGRATCAAFSNDGLHCAVHLYDSTDPLFPNRIERFSLASGGSLGVVTSSTTVPLGPSGSTLPAADETGSTLLLATAEGIAHIDLTSGATQILSGASQGALSADGTRILMAQGAAYAAVDASTGVTLARFATVGGTLPGACWSAPSGYQFAALNPSVDRIEVYDLSGPTPTRRLDVNSGFDAEGDGPWALAFDGTGRTVLAAGRDSDELCIIDVDGAPTVVGRVALDRQPVDVALRADGRALTVHGRGRSLSVVDVASRTELARFPLPDHALAVTAEPTGSAAWVLLQGANLRALVRIDTQTGTISRSVRLPGVATALDGGFLERPAVAYDFARSAAFVALPASGELLRVDLITGDILHAPPVPVTGLGLQQAAGLALRAESAVLVHQAGRGHARAFDVSTGAFVALWEWTCAPSVALDSARAHPFFVDRGSAVVIPFVSTLGPATCPVGVVLDAATGAPLDSLLGASRYGLDLGGEAWLELDQTVFAGLRRVRVSAGSARELGILPLPLQGGSPLVHPTTRIAVTVLGPEGSRDLLHRIDAIDEARFCSPTATNSIGLRATLEIEGSDAAGGTLAAVVAGLRPGSMAGYLLVGDTAVPPLPLPVGPGTLCLGGTLGRFAGQAQTADSSGRHHYAVDTANLPTALGPTAVLPGSTWTFQAWYRDTNPAGGPASHTSDAVRVHFR